MKKKLNLHDLTIISFVTSLEKKAQGNLRGGADIPPLSETCNNVPTIHVCPSAPVECRVPSINASCPTFPVHVHSLDDVCTWM